MKLLVSSVVVVALLSSGCRTHAASAPGSKKINLSASEELRVLHLIQASNEGRKRFEEAGQKYKQQAEADPEYRAARDKTRTAEEAFRAISDKYSAVAEADIEFKAAKANREKRDRELQSAVSGLLESKDCKDCRMERNSDYSFYLTNEKPPDAGKSSGK